MKTPPFPSNLSPAEVAAIETQMQAVMQSLSKVVVEHAAKGVPMHAIISSLSTITGQTTGTFAADEKDLKAFIKNLQWGVKYQAEQAFKARRASAN